MTSDGRRFNFACDVMFAGGGEATIALSEKEILQRVVDPVGTSFISVPGVLVYADSDEPIIVKTTIRASSVDAISECAGSSEEIADIGMAIAEAKKDPELGFLF